MKNISEQLTDEINQNFFLSEFSYDKTKFKTDLLQEHELADHVVVLPDQTWLFQVKERDLGACRNDSSLISWFNKKVLRKAVSQLGDSRRFLDEHSEIVISNRRSHELDIAKGPHSTVQIALHLIKGSVPSSIATTTHKVSKSAGFVHIMSISDYRNMCHCLALPKEMSDYFRFRQEYLLRNPSYRRGEAMLVAMFIAESNEILDDDEARFLLDQALTDTASFDMANILKRFGETCYYIEGDDSVRDYYKVLSEFLKLNRTEMRGIRKHIYWALEECRTKNFSRPLRLIPKTGTGFLTWPVPLGEFNERQKSLKMYAEMAKHQQRLDKQIAVAVAIVGAEFDLTWLYLDYRWKKVEGLDEYIEEHEVLRPLPASRPDFRFRFSEPRS